MPTYQVFREGHYQQADLLFLPDDQGLKYALVVVDCASRLADAEPLKSKNPDTIVNGLKKFGSMI